MVVQSPRRFRRPRNATDFLRQPGLHTADERRLGARDRRREQHATGARDGGPPARARLFRSWWQRGDRAARRDDLPMLQRFDARTKAAHTLVRGRSRSLDRSIDRRASAALRLGRAHPYRTPAYGSIVAPVDDLRGSAHQVTFGPLVHGLAVDLQCATNRLDGAIDVVVGVRVADDQ